MYVLFFYSTKLSFINTHILMHPTSANHQVNNYQGRKLPSRVLEILKGTLSPPTYGQDSYSPNFIEAYTRRNICSFFFTQSYFYANCINEPPMGRHGGQREESAASSDISSGGVSSPGAENGGQDWEDSFDGLVGAEGGQDEDDPPSDATTEAAVDEFRSANQSMASDADFHDVLEEDEERYGEPLEENVPTPSTAGKIKKKRLYRRQFSAEDEGLEMRQPEERFSPMPSKETLSELKNLRSVNKPGLKENETVPTGPRRPRVDYSELNKSKKNV